MTEPPPFGGAWPIGAVANDHVLTTDGWVPFRARSRDSGPPWQVGNLVDGHVLNGAHEWVPVPRPAVVRVPAPPAQSSVERWNRFPVELRIALILIPVLACLYLLGALLG